MRFPTRRRQPPPPSLAQAVRLGALHGLAELLPISSSAHVASVPWLRGWSYAQLEDELRKAFEVALHAGSAATLLAFPGELLRRLLRPSRREAVFLLLTSAPPAAVGLILERPIARRLGTPSTIAGALVGGGLAMALADRVPQRREADDAGHIDALCLGLAQAVALVPGVSRSGATLAAARARGFNRAASRRLSARAGVPVILGAAGLKLVRTLQRSTDERAWLATGAAASFLSTLLFVRPVSWIEERLPLTPFAYYRTALALAILLRRRRDRNAD
jgi:undecaprenyl-diphosphatase